ncbi:MAG: hypothetical protein OXG37_06325 [Actinomycetia bacterium]|nr:hypothetical protein [Actinomycetes bacterium]
MLDPKPDSDVASFCTRLPELTADNNGVNDFHERHPDGGPGGVSERHGPTDT